jgi:hypothetical protein
MITLNKEQGRDAEGGVPYDGDYFQISRTINALI